MLFNVMLFKTTHCCFAFLQLCCSAAPFLFCNSLIHQTCSRLHYLIRHVLSLPFSDFVGFGHPFSQWDGDAKKLNLVSNLGFPSSFSYSFPVAIVGALLAVVTQEVANILSGGTGQIWPWAASTAGGVGRRFIWGIWCPMVTVFTLSLSSSLKSLNPWNGCHNGHWLAGPSLPSCWCCCFRHLCCLSYLQHFIKLFGIWCASHLLKFSDDFLPDSWVADPGQEHPNILAILC